MKGSNAIFFFFAGLIVGMSRNDFGEVIKGHETAMSMILIFLVFAAIGYAVDYVFSAKLGIAKYNRYMKKAKRKEMEKEAQFIPIKKGESGN